MHAAEYKHLVLGLIFVKYVSDTFAARRAELTARLSNLNDDYFLPDADADALAPTWTTGTTTRGVGAGLGAEGVAGSRVYRCDGRDWWWNTQNIHS